MLGWTLNGSSSAAAVTVAFKVDRLGSSSVSYKIGLFDEGLAMPAAEGTFVHVYVDDDGKPTPIKAELRSALQKLVVVT
eukprot:gene3414-31684_t